eukprot:TRINITY_DN10244_c0_g1_i1.p1 TRINITY_DN10244_c0_g1~~TRINITY_DN10244_c0_g1_i1.p1  ORF type:complete len:124 (-),score=10.26 TRINITY_DN10244_c0_g1_i1:83-454(-)
MHSSTGTSSSLKGLYPYQELREMLRKKRSRSYVITEAGDQTTEKANKIMINISTDRNSISWVDRPLKSLEMLAQDNRLEEIETIIPGIVFCLLSKMHGFLSFQIDKKIVHGSNLMKPLVLRPE